MSFRLKEIGTYFSNALGWLSPRQSEVRRTVSTTSSIAGLDIAKETITNRFLSYYVFDPMFGIGDYLQIPKTDSLANFSEQFSPHGSKALRIALDLKDNAPQGKVKQILKELLKIKEVGHNKLPEEAIYEMKLQGMPTGVTVEDIKNAENDLIPQFAALFGLDKSTTESEFLLASELVLSVLQREKYGLSPTAGDEELAAAMMNQVNNS